MNCPNKLLLQGDLKSGGRFFDLRLVEWGLGDELLKLATRIGALEQHEPERQFGTDAAGPAQPHLINKFINGFLRGVAAQVDNHSAATLLQHTIHLAHGELRLTEILEGGAAEQKIETLVGERSV